MTSSGAALAVALALVAGIPADPTVFVKDSVSTAALALPVATTEVAEPKPAEAPELSRARSLIAQVDALDPAVVTPALAAARDDLDRTLTTYLAQQDAANARAASPTEPRDPTLDPASPPEPASPSTDVIAGAVVAEVPQKPSEPSASQTVAEPPQVSGELVAPVAGAAPPSDPNVTGESDPADGSGSDPTIPQRVLPEHGVSAPDGADPEEAVAVTSAAGVVRLVDVVAAADRLAALLHISIEVPAPVAPEVSAGATLADQLAAAVAKYGSSTDLYENGRVPASALCGLTRATGHMLRCDAAERLDALAAEFERAFGHRLAITDSYRPIEAQIALKAMKPYLAAVPGTSQHGWGLAVDFGGTIPSGTSPEYIWLRANAPDYGWDNPAWARPSGSKPEPWHFEFFAGGPMPTRYTPAEPLTPSAPGTPAPVVPVVPDANVVAPAAPTPDPGVPTAPALPSPDPSEEPSPSPSPDPSQEPSPSPEPSQEPSPEPSQEPTASPTEPTPPEQLTPGLDEGWNPRGTHEGAQGTD